MIKKKKLALAKLANDAKSLYAEMEGDESKRTPENREKFDKYIEDGKSLRAEIDQLETLEGINAYTNEPGGNDGKNVDGVGTEGEGGAPHPFARKSYGELVI